MYFSNRRGVRLDSHKKPAINRPIETPEPSPGAVVPLYTLGRTRLETTVGLGEKLAKFAPLAISKIRNHAIVSPVSGTLKNIETLTHPFLGRVPCALIQLDPELPPLKMRGFSLEEISEEEILELSKVAGIIDEYDGLPLYKKLRAFREERIRLVVCDVVEDEPYVSGGIRCLLERPADVAEGLRIALKATGAAKGAVAVVDNGDCKELSKVRNSVEGMNLLRVSGAYPIWTGLEKKIKSNFGAFGKIGIQACLALADAVQKGQPQTDIVVTVSGDCIEKAVNVSVPIGTPISHIVKWCGLKREPDWIVIGDMMSGVPLEDLGVPVVPGIRSITALAHRPGPKKAPCIGCGRCIDVCPVEIMPYFVAKFFARGETDLALSYGASRCLGCGACSAVCPSGIELAAIMESVLNESAQNTMDWSDLG